MSVVAVTNTRPRGDLQEADRIVDSLSELTAGRFPTTALRLVLLSGCCGVGRPWLCRLGPRPAMNQHDPQFIEQVHR